MASRPRVVVTNRAFPETLQLLSAHAEVLANDSPEPWTSGELVSRCELADALMVFMTDRVDADLIARCRRLKVIGAALKGYDNIDVRAAEKAGVWVTIVPDLLTIPTAELAISLMLGVGRHVRLADQAIRRTGFHGWRTSFYGRGLHGSTVGIVGFGRVGRAIAERLIGFRAKLLAWDQCSEAVLSTFADTVIAASLDQILESADYVVLALPLTPATQHIMSRERIAKMKQGALLINPARGSLVDERAVADAIESNHISGYAADVFECEDWARADRPSNIDPRLLADCAPTLLTSHIGSAVIDVRRDIELAAARSIIEVLSGRLPSEAINAPPQPRSHAVSSNGE